MGNAIDMTIPLVMSEMNKILAWIFASILLAECIFAGTFKDLNADTIGEIANKLKSKDLIRLSATDKAIHAAVEIRQDIEEFVEHRLSTIENVTDESEIHNMISGEIASMNGPRTFLANDFFAVKTPFLMDGNRSDRTASLVNTLDRIKTSMARRMEEYSSTQARGVVRVVFDDSNENSAFAYAKVHNRNIEDVTMCINGAYDKAMKECVRGDPVKICNVYSFVCGLRVSSAAR